MRLIDADALEALVKGYGCDKCPGGTLQCTFCTLNQFIAMIDSAPTIDAAPVRRSEWKYFHKQNRAVCTRCSFERDLDTDFGAAVSCPNCGADMRGETHGID